MSDRVEQQHEEVLVRVVDVLDRAGIPFALMGGLAAATVGRERSTKDVDLFLTREDAESALAPLADAGFRTERTDPGWLFKAFWGESLVDLIFESSGGILFDEEVRAHLRQVSVRGRQVPALSPEDIVIIKALANAEHLKLSGDLTLHGVTRPAELDAWYFGQVTDGRGQTRRSFTAETSVRRGDFNLLMSSDRAERSIAGEVVNLTIDVIATRISD